MARGALRSAALVDAACVVPMFFPRAAAAMLGIDGWTPGPDCRYVMDVAAALMLGWTLVLLWADRAPVDRRGIILLTAFPVLPSLAAAGCVAVASGFVSASAMAPAWVVQAALESALIVGFVQAARAARAGKATS